LQVVWPWGEAACVQEVVERLGERWAPAEKEAAVWKRCADAAASGHLLVDLANVQLIRLTPLICLPPDAPPVLPDPLPSELESRDRQVEPRSYSIGFEEEKDGKHLLFELLVQEGVECLICDDAHDLSMPHLIFLKELTDQLFLAFPSHPLGLCLVTAGRGASIPLKDVFDQPETMWMQFRRRLDGLHPYCRVASHTEGEVRDILLALEHIYRPSFPALNLQQWAGSMYTWLTHPLLDPQKSGRVLMDHLMKLVTTALQWSYAKAEEDVSPEHLEAAADQLTLRRDKRHVFDAEQAKKEDESERPESPEEPGESKPKEKKEEKRGRKKRSLKETEPPNPK
jgi:hypothetical protein